MLVREIMSSQIAAVDVDSSLLDAAVKMKLYGIGMLVVSRAGGLAGLITDRDLVVRGMAEGADPTLVKVEHLMSTQFVSCREDDNVESAAARMRDEQVRRLVVLDARGEPAGVISLADIAARAGYFDLAGRVVEAHARPAELETVRTLSEE